jgi:hypothetical protein
MTIFCNTSAVEDEVMAVCSYWFEGVLLVGG